MEKTIGNSSIILKAFLITFTLFCVLLLMSIITGTDIRGTESNVIYTIQSILSDNNLFYQNPNDLPYAVTQYTPLYYLICDGVLSLFGIKATSALTTIVVTRCISFLFLAISAYIFYQIISQFHIKKSLLLLFVTLFIAATFPWYSISRPDVLVLFFVLISIRVLQQYLKSHDFWYCIIIGIFCFMAIASKQNGFILPFTIGLFFLILKAWKSIALMVFGFVLGGATIYAILLIGQYDLTFLKANIIDGINNDMDFIYALNRPYLNFVIYFGLFSVVFYYLLKGSFKHWLKPQFSIKFFLMLSLVVWFFMSLILALKVGSGVNYFNEAIIIALLIFYFELGHKMKLKTFDVQRMNTLLCLIGIQICLVHFYHYPIKIAKGLYETYMSDSSVRSDISLLLTNNLGDSYFFSDDRKVNLANYKHCILPQVEILEASLDSKNFDFNHLKQSFENGSIKYLILYTKLRPILDIEIEDLYRFEKQIGNLNIYKFKDY